MTSYCLNMYKFHFQRAPRKSNKPEDTQYEEIDVCHERPIGVIKQACQNNASSEWNVPDNTSTTPDDSLDSANVVRNVAYESYDSHN